MHKKPLNNQKISNQKYRRAKCCICCGSDDLAKSPAIIMPFVAHRALGYPPVEIDASWGLNSIPNGKAYSICNSISCQSCGHLFLDIRFDDDELSSLYADYRGQTYSQLRDFYEPGYISRNTGLNEEINYLEQIESFIQPFLSGKAKLLDWGGDTGKNTPFKTNNDLFHIYDISNKKVVNGAQRVSIETTISTDYNLVVCSNVLEHVPYPACLLSDITNAMSDDTCLYIEVPYEAIVKQSTPSELLSLNKLKKHWHEHINFYNPQSIQALVQNCGMRVLANNVTQVTVGSSSTAILQLICKLTASTKLTT